MWSWVIADRRWSDESLCDGGLLLECLLSGFIYKTYFWRNTYWHDRSCIQSLSFQTLYLSISNCIVKMRRQTANALQIMHYSRPKNRKHGFGYRAGKIQYRFIYVDNAACRKILFRFTTIRCWIFNNIDVRKRWHQPLAGLVCGVKWRSRQSPRPSDELNRTLQRTCCNIATHECTFRRTIPLKIIWSHKKWQSASSNDGKSPKGNDRSIGRHLVSNVSADRFSGEFLIVFIWEFSDWFDVSEIGFEQ